MGRAGGCRSWSRRMTRPIRSCPGWWIPRMCARWRPPMLRPLRRRMPSAPCAIAPASATSCGTARWGARMRPARRPMGGRVRCLPSSMRRRSIPRRGAGVLRLRTAWRTGWSPAFPAPPCCGRRPTSRRTRPCSIPGFPVFRWRSCRAAAGRRGWRPAAGAGGDGGSAGRAARCAACGHGGAAAAGAGGGDRGHHQDVRAHRGAAAGGMA